MPRLGMRIKVYEVTTVNFDSRGDREKKGEKIGTEKDDSAN